MLVVAVALLGGVFLGMPHTALAQGSEGSGYYVTFAARWCPNYTDVYANRARNNVMESLKDLGPDSPYGPAWGANGYDQVTPAVEDNPGGRQALAPDGPCHPITGWRFTMGTAKVPRAVTGAWGSLSAVTDQEFAVGGPNTIFPTRIVTRSSTPLLDQDAQATGKTLPGATTIELTEQELATWNGPGNHHGECGGWWYPVLPQDVCLGLFVQGGTPDDPVLAREFGTVDNPTYAWAALRCANDNNYADNSEFIQFPSGTRHVFCYAYYVKPAPPAGTITIRKQVENGNGDHPPFPFDGSINFGTGPFELAHDQSETFDRAAGQTWTVTEGDVAGYHLVDIDCGQSRVSISGSTAAIHLATGEHVTCTFINRYGPPPGGLRITKITRGGVGTFHYHVTPVGSGERTSASATTFEPGVPVDARPSLTDLAPGDYRIREVRPRSRDGRWRLRSVECNGESRPTRGPVHVTIAADTPTACTFRNTFIPRGSISIGKVTHGGTGTAHFTVSGAPATPDPRGMPQLDRLLSVTTNAPGVEARAKPVNPQRDSTEHLRLGHYLIREEGPASTPPDRWSLTSVTCNGVQVPFAEGAIPVTLTRSEPRVHCVFGNTFTRHPAPPPKPDPGPDDQPAEQSADLSVTKRASRRVVQRGQTVTFRITVANHGPDHASGVILHDQPIGSGRAVAIRTSSGRCSARLPLMCRLGTLKPGARVHVTVRVRVTAHTHLRNRAVVGSATHDPKPGNGVDAARVRVVRPPPFTG